MRGKTVIYGEDDLVGPWVSERTSGYWVPGSGTTIGYKQSGELIAGVVFSTWNGPNVFLDVAAAPGKLWATEEFLCAVFGYVFVQLNCRRASGIVEASNTRARRLNERLGFWVEAVLADAAPDGDLLIYSMRRENCLWPAGINFEGAPHNGT